MISAGLEGIANQDVTGYVTSILVGFLAGYAVQIRVPRSVTSGGTWVWVLPVSLVALGSIYDLLELPTELPKLFYGMTHVWGVFFAFVTLPAVACCFYSLGIVVADRRRRRPAT